MHVITKTPLFFTVLALAVLMLAGCRKKENMEVDNETQSVVDYAIADQEFMALAPAIYQSALVTAGTGAGAAITAAACDTLSLFSGVRDSTDFSSAPVYVFTPSSASCGLTMPDGKTRSGKVHVRLTGKVRLSGSKMIFKLNSYKASDISYSCDSMVLTTVESTATRVILNVKLINGVCVTGASTIRYRFDRNFTIYPKANGSPETIAQVNGEASGINRQGGKFSTIISPGNPLVKSGNCRYISKGIMELTPDGFKPRVVDFGDGTCDDTATFTVKENTVAFKLK